MRIIRLLAPLLFLLALVTAPLWAQAPPFEPTPVVAFVNTGGGWAPWTAGTGANPAAATPLSVALYCQITTGGTWTPCNPNASGNGVVAINGVPGSYTFEGNGVSCSGTTCTFQNGGGTVVNFAAPTASWPSWLQPIVSGATSSVSLSVAATAIPNSALANDSMSINTVLCTLGEACSVDVGTGTVTSINATVPPWLTVSGVPITTDGTIAIGAASEPAGYFIASPATATGALTARPIVVSDIPTLNQNTTGQAGTVETILGLIQAGTNITLTGNGSVGTPYVVSTTSVGATLSYPGIVYATSATTGDIATSAQIQTAIGSAVYDFYGAAADVQAESLQVENNLSDLESITTARTNLGLGTLATQNATAIAVTGGTLAGVSVNGVTLQSGGSATEYLTAAGTYTTPAGSITSITPTDGLTYSLSGSVATLGLGAITPTAVTTRSITGDYPTLPITAISGITLTAPNIMLFAPNVTLSQANSATSSNNYNSTQFSLSGAYWDGTYSSDDQWFINTVLGAGSNPTSVLTFWHTGTPGATSVSFPAISATSATVTSTAATGANPLNVVDTALTSGLLGITVGLDAGVTQYNSAVFGFNNVGAGTTTNTATMGTYEGLPITVDGLGDLVVPGNIALNNGTLTVTSTVTGYGQTPIAALQPYIAPNATISIVAGIDAYLLYDGAALQFKNVGGSGSYANMAEIGLTASPYQLTVDGKGDVGIPGITTTPGWLLGSQTVTFTPVTSGVGTASCVVGFTCTQFSGAVTFTPTSAITAGSVLFTLNFMTAKSSMDVVCQFGSMLAVGGSLMAGNISQDTPFSTSTASIGFAGTLASGSTYEFNYQCF